MTVIRSKKGTQLFLKRAAPPFSFWLRKIETTGGNRKPGAVRLRALTENVSAGFPMRIVPMQVRTTTHTTTPSSSLTTTPPVWALPLGGRSC